MGRKICRHATQAIRLSEFRRALRQRDALCCEICAIPVARANHRSNGAASNSNSNRSRSSSTASTDSGSGSRRGGDPLLASLAASEDADSLQGWNENPAWRDLYVCITCGFVGCGDRKHLIQHFQMQPKHFVGFHLASKTFWCCPCRTEIDAAAKNKVQEALQSCCEVFAEVASKQQRRVKHKVTPVLTHSASNSTSSSTSISTSASEGSGRGGRPLTDDEAVGRDLLSHPHLEDYAYSSSSSRRRRMDVEASSSVEASTSQTSPIYQTRGMHDRRGGPPPSPGRLPYTPPLVPQQDSAPLPRLQSIVLGSSSRGIAKDGSSRGIVKDGSSRGIVNDGSVRAMVPQEDDAVELERGTIIIPSVPLGSLVNDRDDARVDIASSIASPPQTDSVLSLFGFSNLGNTCYFNSAMQALITAMHYFPEAIHEDEVIEAISTRPISATFVMLNQTIVKKARQYPWREISDTPRKATLSIRSNKRPVLTVGPLLKAVRRQFGQFRGTSQQDAHELLTSMLWAIDEEMDPPSPEDPADPTYDDCNSDEQGGSDTEMMNIFVKTDTGETISMLVPPGTTAEDLQVMLAKKLNLSSDDMYLHAGANYRRSTIGSIGSIASSRRSTISGSKRPPSFCKENFVRYLFGGELTTAVTCHSCGNCSEIVEDAFQLSCSIPANKSARDLSVRDCLDAFTVDTALRVDDGNGYDCEKCSRAPVVKDFTDDDARLYHRETSTSTHKPALLLRDASMSLRISQLPRVLVVHLKRLGRLRKITQHIQFDTSLDLAPYHGYNANADCSEFKRGPLPLPTRYELIAVVVHKGGKRAGHYVAYVSRGHEDHPGEMNDSGASSSSSSSSSPRRWFYVSDSVVQRVSLDIVLQCEAYMLFYRQLPAVPHSQL